MRLSTRLIERYIAAAIIPYTVLGLLLLTAALLAQQTARLADVLGGARTTTTLLIEVLLALLPNILLFTLPMAVLVGTATGFSRLGSDSELTALKAAGVGNLRIVAPACLLGLLATGVALYDGLVIAPAAAGELRQTVLRAALYKLESPVEPNTFNTELPDKVIYVREGDLTRGQWGRVFIHWLEPGQPTRIVTARTGRIDTTGGQSELVLSDAEVTTLPTADNSAVAKLGAAAGQLVTERSAQLRVRMNTGREALIQRLQTAPAELDELGLGELLARVRQSTGVARRAVLQALHKRLALCSAPLALALLGAGLGLRVRRGGRGVGVLLSLGAMLCFYLLLLAGDQLGRTGLVPVAAGAWLAPGLALLAGALLLLLHGRGSFLTHWPGRLRLPFRQERKGTAETRRRVWVAMPLGLLDRSLLRALGLNFIMALVTLVGIFLIFTLFELLRYLNGSAAKLWLLARYLFFLIPLASVNITPVAALVTALITYALLARRSETVAWWAAGQSVYRLALPGLLFAGAVGCGLWLVQEDVLPQGNRRQESLRAQLRGGAAQQAMTEVGRQWLALPDSPRIYTYRYDQAAGQLIEPVIFEFDSEGVHVRRIVSGTSGVWTAPGRLTLRAAQVIEPAGGANAIKFAVAYQLADALPAQLFKPLLNKPGELNSRRLSEYLKTLKQQRGADVRAYELALARRWADPFAPLVMLLLGLPLALSFGRRTALAALSVAVGAGLAFWGCVSGFQQLGQLKLLPPAVAAFAPLLIFAAVGGYMLTRART